LLVVWSDAYLLLDDFRLVQNPENRYGLPLVALDSRCYRFVDRLSERFPSGAPSLSDCRRLEVIGDVRFESPVKVTDTARVTNEREEQAVVPSGAVLTGEVRLG
jgi:UTP--glucose-1-phosphate uridylyltransferase